MKKDKVIKIVIIVAVILSLIGVIVFINKDNIFKSNKKKEENSNTNINSNLLEDNSDNVINIYDLVIEKKDSQNNKTVKDTFKFYQNDKLVNTYTCSGRECKVLTFKDGEKKLYGDYVFIARCDAKTCNEIGNYMYRYYFYGNVEGDSGSGTIIQYNIKTGEEKTFDNVYGMQFNEKNLLELTNVDKSITYVSSDGKNISNYKEDELKFICYEGCSLDSQSYNYDEKLIVAQKDKKYGIIGLFDKNIKVDYKYEDIKLVNDEELYSNKDYFIGKIDGKKNVYKMSDGSNITNKGYEEIYFLDANTLLVLNKNEFSFIDLKENMLTTDTIKFEKLYRWWPKRPEGIIIFKEDNDVEITVSVGDEKNNDEYSYTYNLKTKRLTLNKEEE